jgi:hypothetical protein
MAATAGKGRAFAPGKNQEALGDSRLNVLMG